MPTIFTHRVRRKMQRQFNDLFENVNSFVGNVYKSLSRTPSIMHGFMNGKHKRNNRSRHRHRTR